jgi:hypothetical protein
MRSSAGPGRRQGRCGQPALPEQVTACRATRFCQWLADPGWADAMAWTFDRINAQRTEIIGALGGIRTPDPQIRSLVLYPAELRAHRRVFSEDPGRFQTASHGRGAAATATAPGHTLALNVLSAAPAGNRSTGRRFAQRAGGRRLPCYGPASQAAEEARWPSPTSHPLPSSSA